jgi:hypothetical protein
MNSKFDFNQFKAHYELQEAMRDMSLVLRDTVATISCYSRPNDSAAEIQQTRRLSRPVNKFLQRFESDTPDQEFVFDFNCQGVTMDSVVKHCADATPLLDFTLYVKNIGKKLFYNTTYDTNQPTWAEMTLPEASDPVQGHSELIFLDRANSVIDWRSSLDNLKRLSDERTYTRDMMKACLLKIVSKYVPEQHKLITDKSANQIAGFLLSLDSKIDKMG